MQIFRKYCSRYSSQTFQLHLIRSYLAWICIYGVIRVEWSLEVYPAFVRECAAQAALAEKTMEIVKAIANGWSLEAPILGIWRMRWIYHFVYHISGWKSGPLVCSLETHFCKPVFSFSRKLVSVRASNQFTILAYLVLVAEVCVYSTVVYSRSGYVQSVCAFLTRQEREDSTPRYHINISKSSYKITALTEWSELSCLHSPPNLASRLVTQTVLLQASSSIYL